MSDSREPRARGPVLTADVLITPEDGSRRLVLIRRKHPPPGWALPGGHVEVGETVEQAAAREALEETGLTVRLVRQFHVYSDPRRDPRRHTVSVVFLGRASGEPSGSDDAAEAAWFAHDSLPTEIAFDHAQILQDFFSGRY
jgi:8-oxo-dGTP diphosphatase